MTTRTTTLALAGMLAISGAASAQNMDKMMMPDGPLSQAQLISTLKAHGYSDIKLTTEQPSVQDPHPELSMHVSSVDDAQAKVTAVHIGWNGTAVKNGEPVNVYLKPEAEGSEHQLGGLMIYLDRMALK